MATALLIDADADEDVVELDMSLSSSSSSFVVKMPRSWKRSRKGLQSQGGNGCARSTFEGVSAVG